MDYDEFQACEALAQRLRTQAELLTRNMSQSDVSAARATLQDTATDLEKIARGRMTPKERELRQVVHDMFRLDNAGD